MEIGGNKHKRVYKVVLTGGNVRRARVRSFLCLLLMFLVGF